MGGARRFWEGPRSGVPPSERESQAPIRRTVCGPLVSLCSASGGASASASARSKAGHPSQGAWEEGTPLLHGRTPSAVEKEEFRGRFRRGFRASQSAVGLEPDRLSYIAFHCCDGWKRPIDAVGWKSLASMRRARAGAALYGITTGAVRRHLVRKTANIFGVLSGFPSGLTSGRT